MTKRFHTLLRISVFFVTSALFAAARNPFAPLPKTEAAPKCVATACWHEHDAEATLMQHEEKIWANYKKCGQKKPLQLGKAEGLGG